MAICSSGCTFHHEPQYNRVEASKEQSQEVWRTIQPQSVTKLFVGISDDGGYTFRELVVVDDAVFVQTLYAELAKQKPVTAKPHLMIGPKLIVFMGRDSEPLCSFLYWAAGKPNHILRSCRAKVADNNFHVEWPGPPGNAIVLPTFGERTKKFFNVWE